MYGLHLQRLIFRINNYKVEHRKQEFTHIRLEFDVKTLELEKLMLRLSQNVLQQPLTQVLCRHLWHC